METIVYFFKVLVVSGIFYTVFKLLITKYSSYSFQRLFILFAIIFSFAVPLLSLDLVELSISYIQLPEVVIGANSSNLTIPQNESYITLLLSYLSGDKAKYLYALSVFVLAIIVLAQFGVLAYIIYRSTPLSKEEDNIRLTDVNISPFSFLGFIVIRKGYSQIEQETILKHEREHIDRLHSLDLLITKLLQLFLWFNPFFYLLRRELLSVHEFEVDQRVMNDGVNPIFYKKLLIKEQLGFLPIGANHFSKLLTIKRLKNMEKTTQKENRFLSSVVMLTTVLITFIFCSGNIILAKSSEQDKTKESSKSVVDKKAKSETISKEEKEYSFDQVEKKPSFMGGDEYKFTTWIVQNMKYPQAALKANKQGRVIVSFTVNEQGNVVDAKVLRGVSPELDKEALRVVNSSPKWEPGEAKGKKVKVRFTFPVVYKLK